MLSKNTKKKVLIVANHISQKDGQGRYALEMIWRLAKEFDLIVLFSHRDEGEIFNIQGVIATHKIPSIRLLNNKFFSFFYSWLIWRFYFKVDFIHFLSDFPYCTLFSSWPFKKKPRFITTHGTYAVAPLDMPKHRARLIKAYRQATKIFCVSNFTKKMILKRVSLNNLLTINNGVNFDKFKNYSNVVNGPNKEEKIIIGVGMLKARKGYHISIPAIAEVYKKYKYLKYYIIGDQSKKEYFYQLKELVKKFNLSEVIVFKENISDFELLDLYCKANLFLLTPININEHNFEGFGLVYLEAGACGLPVIGTYNCGAEDAIKENQTGLLVPQNDINKTAEAIRKILNNPDLANKLSRQGIINARENDWGKLIQRYLEIYQGLEK